MTKRDVPARSPPAALLAAVGVMALTLCACGEPPGWQQLLTSKIKEQYPQFTVHPHPDGNLLVQRPGKASVPVDVQSIALHCQRGPKDCNYATDQMLLELRP